MVPIEDSGVDTNDTVLRDREQGQHASQSSIPSPTRFLLQWVTASLLGAGIVATLGAAMLGSNAYFPPWRLALFLGLVGLGVGAGQGVVIARLWPGSPRPIRRGVWWMLGTAVGLSIGIALGLALSFPVFFILYALEGYYWVTVLANIPLIMGIVVDVVAAVSISLAQLLLLRRYTGTLGRWKFASFATGVVGSAVAWGAGLAAGYGIGAALPAIPILQGAVGGVVGGLIVGVITGLAMLRIVSGGGSTGDVALPKAPEAEG